MANKDNNNPTFIGPDYGQMMKQSTNSAIIEHFMGILLNKTGKFDAKTFLHLFRGVILAIIVKTAIEESKSFMDTMKFTNFNFVRYLIQCIRVRHKTFVLYKYSENTKPEATVTKWTYDERLINSNLMKTYLEKKGVFIEQPGNYYFPSGGYLIKTIISPNSISFVVPELPTCINEVEINIIRNSFDISFGSSTQVYRGTAMSASSHVPNLELMAYSSAFETDNYRKLKNALRRFVTVTKQVQQTAVPYVLNFDGPPGTGKTTFCSYLASTDIVDVCLIINMVQFNKCAFSQFLNALKSKFEPLIKDISGNSPTILIMFDEIDKWLDSYVDNQIIEIRDKSKVTKQATGAPTDSKSGAPAVVENFKEMTTEEELEKRKNLRHEFFDTLLALVDGLFYPTNRTYILIFNTNHFGRMFDMSTLAEKYHALVNRFERYRFDKGTKRDIINYFNNTVKKVEQTLESKDLTTEKKKEIAESLSGTLNVDPQIYEKLPNDIRISYRDLNKNFRASGYDIRKTIDQIVDFVNRKASDITEVDTSDSDRIISTSTTD